MYNISTKSIWIFIVVVILFITSLALFISSNQKDKYGKKQFNHNLNHTIAKVIDIQANYYRCCKIDYCDKCQDASYYNSCQYMKDHQIEGYCSNGQACCIENKYYCCDNDDDYQYKLFNTTHNKDPCQSDYSTCWCYECRLCMINHRCYSKCGNCSKPIMILNYMIQNGIRVNKTFYGNCGMNDNNCLDKFFRGLHNGSFIDIYYKKSEPTKIYFTKPNYNSSSSVKLEYVFGSLFLFGMIVLFGFAIFNHYFEESNNNEYQRI